MALHPSERRSIDMLDQLSVSPHTAAEAVEKIAQQFLGLDTLKTRDSNSLDFHELPVWALQEALEMAFRAGMAHGQGTPPRTHLEGYSPLGRRTTYTPQSF